MKVTFNPPFSFPLISNFPFRRKADLKIVIFKLEMITNNCTSNETGGEISYFILLLPTHSHGELIKKKYIKLMSISRTPEKGKKKFKKNKILLSFTFRQIPNNITRNGRIHVCIFCSVLSLISICIIFHGKYVRKYVYYRLYRENDYLKCYSNKELHRISSVFTTKKYSVAYSFARPK